MSNYIAGYIYGNIKGENHIMGSFYDSRFMGNLKYLNLLNDNFCDCLINRDQISGKLEGKYTSGEIKGDIKANLLGPIKSTEEGNPNELLRDVNFCLSYIDPIYKISYVDNQYLFPSESNKNVNVNIFGSSSLFTQMLTVDKQFMAYKDCIHYVFKIVSLDTGDVKMWKIPIGKITKLAVLCELTNVSTVPVDNMSDIYEFDFLAKEIRKEKPKQNVKPFPVTNNLFTPYTTFTPPATKYFNNKYGEAIGLVHNVNPNETTINTYFHVFENPSNNTSNGPQNGNNVVMSDEKTRIFDTIYNYEKYNRYRHKVDISKMTELEKLTFLDEYSKTYKIDVLRIDDIIYGIYIK